MRDELIPIRSAPECGISRGAIRDAIADGRVTIFASESDRRRRFVRRADLDRLREMRPIAAGRRFDPLNERREDANGSAA